MRIEVIAIGDEILAGSTLNANGAFIARHVSLLGWEVMRQTVVPDDPFMLQREIDAALERSDVVLCTGGLGPTCDDLTRAVAASLFDSSFHFDEAVAADLKRRYGEELSSLQDQATVPSKAEVFINRVGTAPGLAFCLSKRCLILMPGPPPEMEPMLLNQVIPYLQTHFVQAKKIHAEHVFLCLQTENAVDPLLRTLQQEFPSLRIGIYPGYGTLAVLFSSENGEAVIKAKEQLINAFATYVFSAPSGKIEEALHLELIKQNKTIAFAESCTGGMLAEKMTALPGASDYFLGSIVAYSNEMKIQQLRVKKKTIQAHGAVSKEVVEEMLNGLFEVTNADYGIAVSGIAGPTGGSAEKPIGTIWAAYGARGKAPEVVTFLAMGSRQTIILFSSIRLLAMLWRHMKGVALV